MEHPAWPKRLVIDWARGGNDLEDILLVKAAKELDIPIERSTCSMMERGRTPITADDLCAGGIPFIVQCLHKLKIEVPQENSYPSSLQPWLYRNVRQDVLWKVRERFAINQEPIFVKPASDSWKKFTGFVLKDSNDYRLASASKYTRVWTSDPIEIVSEWRVYVAHGEILAAEYYWGKPLAIPDPREIQKAIATLVEAKEAPAGFAIDFGVDSEGRTILVEMNGGFSVGAYGGLLNYHYWTMACAYWHHLTHPEPLTIPA
jgi:hypothetical protein